MQWNVDSNMGSIWWDSITSLVSFWQRLFWQNSSHMFGKVINWTIRWRARFSVLTMCELVFPWKSFHRYPYILILSQKTHIPLQISLTPVLLYVLMLMLLIELFALSGFYIGPRSISKDLLIRQEEDTQNVDINLEERRIIFCMWTRKRTLWLD